MTTPINITRGPIWFDDGSIVLQAETTQFCVHGGYLSQQSTVFRDILSIPQGNDVEAVEGRPLVRVWDSAEDMAHLLQALYDSDGDLLNTRLDYDTYEMLCAVLRLSSKYMVPRLRKTVAKVFVAAYPPTLSLWDVETQRITAEYRDSIDGGEDDDTPEPEVQTPCPGVSHVATPLSTPDWDYAALSACAEANLLSPLPGAYYRCAVLPVERTFDSPLSAPDKQKVAVGRERLRKRVADGLNPNRAASSSSSSILFFFDEGHDACVESVRVCQREWANDAVDVECHPLAETFITESLALESTSLLKPLCESCLGSLKEEWTEWRKEVFQALPGLFGLERWEVLAERDRKFQELLAVNNPVADRPANFVSYSTN